MKAMAFGLLFAAPVAAENESTPCLIDVRSLIGTDPAEENTRKKLEAGKFVADLHDQLEALPFQHFETLGHEQQRVALHDKATFHLKSADGSRNSVLVKVDCITEVGATLKIDWSNEAGGSIVSTQVRLPDGKNWVLGTDHEDRSATIVSIKVECHENGADKPN